MRQTHGNNDNKEAAIKPNKASMKYHMRNINTGDQVGAPSVRVMRKAAKMPLSTLMLFRICAMEDLLSDKALWHRMNSHFPMCHSIQCLSILYLDQS